MQVTQQNRFDMKENDFLNNLFRLTRSTKQSATRFEAVDI